MNLIVRTENYESFVKYKNEVFPIYMNVGKARNDGNYHIYDFTNKLRDTAHRINDVESPVGNFLETASLNESIQQDSTISQEKLSDREYLNLAKNPEANSDRLRELVNKATEEAGYSKPMYHGSKKSADIKVFKDWQYNNYKNVTGIIKSLEDNEYAEDYIYKILGTYEEISGNILKKYQREADRFIDYSEWTRTYRKQYLRSLAKGKSKGKGSSYSNGRTVSEVRGVKYSDREYITTLEDRNYDNKQVLERILRPYSKNVGRVLGRYSSRDNRFIRYGRKISQSGANPQNQSNGAGASGANQTNVKFDLRDNEYLEFARNPKQNESRLCEMVDEEAKKKIP